MTDFGLEQKFSFCRIHFVCQIKRSITRFVQFPKYKYRSLFCGNQADVFVTACTARSIT